jgi:hypothetical protein
MLGGYWSDNSASSVSSDEEDTFEEESESDYSAADAQEPKVRKTWVLTGSVDSWAQTRTSQIHELLMVFHGAGFLTMDQVERAHNYAGKMIAVVQVGEPKGEWDESHMASSSFWAKVLAQMMFYEDNGGWFCQSHNNEDARHASEAWSFENLHKLLLGDKGKHFRVDEGGGGYLTNVGSSAGRKFGFSRLVTMDDKKRRCLDVRNAGTPNMRRKKMETLNTVLVEASFTFPGLPEIPVEIYKMQPPEVRLFKNCNTVRLKKFMEIEATYEQKTAASAAQFARRQAEMGIRKHVPKRKERDLVQEMHGSDDDEIPGVEYDPEELARIRRRKTGGPSRQPAERESEIEAVRAPSPDRLTDAQQKDSAIQAMLAAHAGQVQAAQHVPEAPEAPEAPEVAQEPAPEVAQESQESEVAQEPEEDDEIAALEAQLAAAKAAKAAKAEAARVASEEAARAQAEAAEAASALSDDSDSDSDSESMAGEAPVASDSEEDGGEEMEQDQMVHTETGGAGPSQQPLDDGDEDLDFINQNRQEPANPEMQRHVLQQAAEATEIHQRNMERLQNSEVALKKLERGEKLSKRDEADLDWRERLDPAALREGRVVPVRRKKQKSWEQIVKKRREELEKQRRKESRRQARDLRREKKALEKAAKMQDKEEAARQREEIERQRQQRRRERDEARMQKASAFLTSAIRKKHEKEKVRLETQQKRADEKLERARKNNRLAVVATPGTLMLKINLPKQKPLKVQNLPKMDGYARFFASERIAQTDGCVPLPWPAPGSFGTGTVQVDLTPRPGARAGTRAGARAAAMPDGQ